MFSGRGGSFDVLWQGGFIEDCLDNYQRWTSLPNVLISRYEEIIAYLPTEVERIANHLNIPISAGRCQEIADSYSVEVQKQRIDRFKTQLLNTSLNPNEHRDIVDYHDENSLLHMNHINAVKSGQWKEDLSPEQVVLIEHRVNHWCAENGYPPSTFLPEKVSAI